MRTVVGLLCLLPLHAACGAQGPPQRPTRIVLITLDTLRHDHFTGQQGEGMPAVRRFAAGGLSFTSCFSSTSATQPTHASLLTGRQPWEHGVTRNGIVLDDEEVTLAEHLRQRGFTTHAVVASFPLHSMFGYEQGFDRFEDEFAEPYANVWQGRRTEAGGFFCLASSVTERALAALDAARGERQFFWFHYFDPHDPYGDAAGPEEGVVGIGTLMRAVRERDPALEERLAAARAAYARDVAFLDRSLGRLLERLAADGERFATHVLLTADHGESFGELDALGHGNRVTREQLQVPLVLVSPAVEPGLRSDDASTVDVPRTLLRAAGVDAGGFGGRDLLAEGLESVVLGMRRTYAEPPSKAVPPAWFYVVRDGELWSGNAETVLEEDDRERPVGEADVQGESLRALFAALERRLEECGTGDELLDPAAQEGLRALGYTR